MLIFKQSRYVALLVSVILVCFSAITLMNPGAVSEGKQSRVQMVKLQSPGLKGNLPMAGEVSDIRTKQKAQTKLNIAAAAFIPVWEARTELLVTESIKEEVPAAPVKASAASAFAAAPTTVKPKITAAAGVHQTVQKITASQQKSPTTLFFTRTMLLNQEEQSKATWIYAVSEEEVLLLQKIVMAEAESEPYQGKVAVANVVLNRLRSANFPDTIKDVIYQKSQFSPVANGRLKRVQPNEDSIRAVEAALSGIKEVSDDTYFFLSLKLAQDLTVHHSRTYAKTIGNHTFYK
ncbi:cell wall hydrolase [Paenibacillus sp. sgz500958]|uniref:cell wall hydrolase n=1 Tax=Paenibacillus sp. sgz500958 TaxID=3242475 RepID=UPI0036D22B1C